MQKVTQIFISDNSQDMSLKLKTNSEILKDIYYDYKYDLFNNNSIEEFLLENYEEDIIKTYRKLNVYSKFLSNYYYRTVYRLNSNEKKIINKENFI